MGRYKGFTFNQLRRLVSPVAQKKDSARMEFSRVRPGIQHARHRKRIANGAGRLIPMDLPFESFLLRPLRSVPNAKGRTAFVATGFGVVSSSIQDAKWQVLVLVFLEVKPSNMG